MMFRTLVTSLSMRMGLSGTSPANLRYVTAEEATKIDEKLFEYFSVDVLMELAGLSVAAAVKDHYPVCRVLCLCGPGNNGGDGLVAARHLQFFGFKPLCVYPKQKFPALVKQCELSKIPVLPYLPRDWHQDFDLVIDALFGFSYKPPLREPFAAIVKEVAAKKLPIVAVDVPSGWDVNEGPTDENLPPSMLVSLTAPKLCAKKFLGPHYLGGRFVPDSVQEEFNFRQPPFPGADQIVRLDTMDDLTVAADEDEEKDDAEETEEDDESSSPQSKYYYF